LNGVTVAESPRHPTKIPIVRVGPVAPFERSVIIRTSAASRSSSERKQQTLRLQSRASFFQPCAKTKRRSRGASGLAASFSSVRISRSIGALENRFP